MRIAALVKRIFWQMLRDKRTLALLFVAPLLILTLMSFVFNGKTVDPTLGVENINEKTVEQLKNADIKVKEFKDVTNIEEKIKENDLDGFLKVEDNKNILTLQNDDPTISKSLKMKVNQVLSLQLQSQMMEQRGLKINMSSQDVIKTDYIYGGDDTGAFDVFSPILIGFFVFFFVFLIAGIGLLKERTTGTLERLFATPIRKREIVAAYLIGFGIFAVIQTIIVVLFSVNVLDIILVGSIWNVILINLLLALAALSLGIFLSSFAATEFQMVQFIPIVIVPQVFFSGIFPIEGMANWLQVFAKAMPLYYAADALKGVMYKGEGLSDISKDLYILIGFTVIFIILNLLALRKYRKI